jgi:subtilisin family serine protease
MKKMKANFGKRLSITGLFFLAATLIMLPASMRAGDGSDGTYHSGRILVKFKSPPSSELLKGFKRNYNIQLERVIPRIQVYRFTIPKTQSVPAVIKRVVKNRRVDFVEPDYVRYPFYTPDDPLFPYQWDMTLMGLPSLWDSGIGIPEVIVAVLDTGIDLDHPDLINQLWQNPGEIPGNRRDDDGNGYVDDFNGYDFAGDGWFPGPWKEDPIPEDLYVGHGTHVSGTIGAEQHNGEGISGIAPGTRIMAVRCLGGILGAGYSSDISEGIIYATDNGASIINMSLGGTAKSSTEYLALKYAWDNNVFIAAAAGNDGDGKNNINYPAAYVFAMSVGATDNADGIASFSTHNEFVEVSAPGVQILSTVPGGGYESAIWSGTSMATPHVAGLAALLYSHFEGISNWQVRFMLQSGVVDRGPEGWDEFFGYGRADGVALLYVSPPSDEGLQILTPPDGVQFRSDALVAALWNPVAGAARYRATTVLPGGAVNVKTLKETYITVHPSVSLPLGNYVFTVEAETSAGALIDSDTVSFSLAK